MKRKIALVLTSLLILTPSFVSIVRTPVPGCDIYVTMGGKVDGQAFLYVNNVGAPNARIGVAIPWGIPFATREPYLSPMQLFQNITFSPPIDVDNDTVPDIIVISKVQLNPIVHYQWVEFTVQWWRFTLQAIGSGGGVIFINPAKPGDVDCYTFNNDTGVYWDAPSQLAGMKAAESGGHFNNVTQDFVPSMASRFPYNGIDALPGTRLWGDPLDGFGDGIADSPGSSILMLPLILLGEEWNATSGLWEPELNVPMPLVLTTGVAYDHVAAPESYLYCLNSTEEGMPWEFLSLGAPWDDPKAFVKVVYVCAWSNLLYSVNADYDGDGVPDPEEGTGYYYTLDFFWEYVEKKVREDVVIADINCDQIVDFKDLYMVAGAYGSKDEGLGPDGIPGTPDDKTVADPNYDARCDLRSPYGQIDIMDVIAVALDYDFIPGYHVPDTWQGKVSVVPSSQAADIGQTFEVNVTVSDVTDLYLALFCIRWNPTVLDLTKDPTPGDFLPGATYHVYARINRTEGVLEAWTGTMLLGVPGQTGSGTVATLEFEVIGPGSSPLDLYNCSWMDSTTGQYGFETVEDGSFVGPPCVFPVTWKWLDEKGNPVWLTANVTVSSSYPIENFSFNRSLGQISFNTTSATPGFCNVSVPKLLMDGAFKVLINDTQVPSILAWNESHTFVHFTYSQGTHNIKIVGETVTRIRGTDLLSLCDVNGDGIVDIVDIVILALRFGWKEDC